MHRGPFAGTAFIHAIVWTWTVFRNYLEAAAASALHAFLHSALPALQCTSHTMYGMLLTGVVLTKGLGDGARMPKYTANERGF